MKIKRYGEPNSTLAFTLGNEGAHHWIVICEADEYNTLIETLKNTKWNRAVRWFPTFVPSKVLTGTSLEAHIVALDDRDATFIKLSL